MRILAIRAHLRSITLSFVFFLPATSTLRRHFAAVTGMAEFVAPKTPQWIGHKQIDLDLQVTDTDHFWNFGFVDGQEQSVGWNDFSVLLHCHPPDFNHALILQLSTHFCLGKFRPFTARNHFLRGLQRLVNANVYNKTLSTPKILSLYLSVTLDQEGPIPVSWCSSGFRLLPGIPSESQKETVSTGGSLHWPISSPGTVANML